MVPAIDTVDLQPLEFEYLTVGRDGSIVERGSGATTRYFETGIEMVRVAGGTFQMGTAAADIEELELAFKRFVPATRVAEWAARQTPQHAVDVPTFFVSRGSVTRAQFFAVAQMPAVDMEIEAAAPAPHEADLPAAHVSWLAANEFCARLARQSGRPYRLLSEAEWEYAARGGTATAYGIGDTIVFDVANFDSAYPFREAPLVKCRLHPLPIGALGAANRYGLWDMHGNVWDWCLDTWHTRYDGAPTDGSAWVGGGVEDHRIIRGGGYFSSAVECRSANRDRVNQAQGNRYVGFRVAVSEGPLAGMGLPEVPA